MFKVVLGRSYAEVLGLLSQPEVEALIRTKSRSPGCQGG